MPVINCDCNAGMERFFPTGKDLAAQDQRFRVFFDLVDPGLSSEERSLQIVDKSTNLLVATINLNNYGGRKPTNSTSPFMPELRPNLKINEPCDTEKERVFCSEIEIADDPNYSVTLHIFVNDDVADYKRFLRVKRKHQFVALDLGDEDITVEEGKKPLGGGALKIKNKPQQYR